MKRSTDLLKKLIYIVIQHINLEWKSTQSIPGKQFCENVRISEMWYLMQIYEPIWRPSKPGPFLAGLYLNSQSIMLMKNAFIMTNQGHIAYRRAETSSGEDGICIKQQSMQQWMLLPYYYTHTQQIMFVSFRI